ncbi:hypothetical protein MACH09_00230 [Vibrio sp. MACH09]|nr:hypothetical protein MACH09_00230 [Vibrio sp. MACH09]
MLWLDIAVMLVVLVAIVMTTYRLHVVTLLRLSVFELSELWYDQLYDIEAIQTLFQQNSNNCLTF